MNQDFNFDEIRPYNDNEVPAAIERLANSEYFNLFIGTIYPGIDIDGFRKEFRSVKTIAEWHDRMWFPLVWHIVDHTSSELTVSGLENIVRDKRYMFISNHRDITLDASILNALLGKHGFQPAEITFGSNLMINQFVTDLGKISKMFRLVRGGNRRDFYKNSMEVSAYMRYAITSKHESVWIAQRNGRTKDGNDLTDPGVLKMFSLSSEKPFSENLAEVNICPISVSYEYEPCDFLKTKELCISATTEKYEKSPLEDMMSIKQGVMQNKGKIHLSICEPVSSDDLKACDSCNKNEKFTALAGIIDSRIHSGYKTQNTNHIAYDILHNTTRFSTEYTAQEKASFEKRMNDGLAGIANDFDGMAKKTFLKIYANPVINQLEKTDTL